MGGGERATWKEVRKLLWQHNLYLLHAMFLDNDKPTYTLRAIFNAIFLATVDVNPNDPSNVWLALKTIPGVIMTLETYEHELRLWHQKNSLVRLKDGGGIWSTVRHWVVHKRNRAKALTSKDTVGFRTTKLYAALLIFIVLVIAALALDSLPEYMRTNLFKLGAQFMNFILGMG